MKTTKTAPYLRFTLSAPMQSTAGRGNLRSCSTQHLARLRRREHPNR